MRVTILHSAIAADATLDEQETMIQVAAVHEALQKLDCQVNRLAFTLDISEFVLHLHEQKPDVVFNVVESVQGRGELIYLPPLLLEQLNIPYTGVDAKTLLLSTDKIIAKEWLLAGQLPTPPWLHQDEWSTKPFPSDGPYIIKSTTENGSIGIDQDSIVNHREAMSAILQDRQRRFGGKWFAERFILGREFNVGLLSGCQGLEVLPIAELQFTHLPDRYFPIMDYAAKWQLDSEIYRTTQRCFEFAATDELMLASIAELSLACGHWFSVAGYARVDMRVDEHGQIWILEINTNPSIAPDAGFVAAAERSGFDYVALINRLLEGALERGGIGRGHYNNINMASKSKIA